MGDAFYIDGSGPTPGLSRRAAPAAALLALLFLPACQAKEGDSAPEEAAAADESLTNLQFADGAADPVHLRELIDRAMPTAVADADKAQYRNVRAGVGGAACGEISTAGGPFRPFVVTPTALAVVGATPKIAYSDPSDFFADAYVRWCATPEEMSHIASEIRRAAADPANVTMALTPQARADIEAAAPVDDTPPPAPSPAPPPPAPAAPAAATKAGPAPTIDSFSDAVRRKGQ